MNVIESHENELAKTKLVNLQLEACKETFALLHPHFPIAALGALIACEPTGLARSHYVCIFAKVPATSTAHFILHHGQQTATRMLAKGPHGVDAFAATHYLLIDLRAQLGTAFRNCWVNGGCPGAGDDSYRRHIEDGEVDKVEVDNAGFDTAKEHNNDEANPEEDHIDDIAGAHDGEDQGTGNIGTTGAVNSADSAPTPGSQPPPPPAEKDSTSTSSGP